MTGGCERRAATPRSARHPTTAATAAGPERPDLLLITVDTVRPDYLRCYGRSDAHTPASDQLAAEGVTFEDAYTPYPLTLPAHASMHTGLLPFEHGIRNNARYGQTDSLVTVAERLAAAGYATAAVVSAFVLDARFGLAQGFEHYDDHLELPADQDHAATQAERRAAATTERALELLGQRDGRPLFLWVHYFDAHAPYDPPAPYQGRGYAGEISSMEQEIARLLLAVAGTGRWERTGIVYAGDHGEAFGEHGEQQHGFFVYDVTLHVPLLVKPPGPRAAPTRCETPVSLVDVAPTLLGWAGVPAPVGGSARSLMDGMKRGDAQRVLYAESLIPLLTHGAAPLSSARRGGWKLIAAPQPELYEVAEDPLEATNLITRDSERAQAMSAELRAIEPPERLAGAAAAVPPAPDADTARQLAALGYAATPPPRPAPQRADPKQVLQAAARIQDGDRRRAAGDLPGATAAYEQALALLPLDWKATWKLADAHVDAGDLAGAEQVLRTALASQPENFGIHLRLAGVLHDEGRAREALELCDQVLERFPEHADAHTMRAVMLHELGHPNQARRELEEVLAEQPDHELAKRSLESLFPEQQPGHHGQR